MPSLRLVPPATVLSLVLYGLAAHPGSGSAFGPHGSESWKTYRSSRAGYAVRYPGAWRVSTRKSADGSLVTMFRQSGGRAGIEITTGIASAEDVTEPSDMPNTRCQPARAHSLIGTTCFDTISFSMVTIFQGGGNTYRIAASGKYVGRQVYDRFVKSFRLLRS
jgi:hypothetical protein